MYIDRMGGLYHQEKTLHTWRRPGGGGNYIESGPTMEKGI